jgi:hypothetical protein
MYLYEFLPSQWLDIRFGKAIARVRLPDRHGPNLNPGRAQYFSRQAWFFGRVGRAATQAWQASAGSQTIFAQRPFHPSTKPNHFHPP